MERQLLKKERPIIMLCASAICIAVYSLFAVALYKVNCLIGMTGEAAYNQGIGSFKTILFFFLLWAITSKWREK